MKSQNAETMHRLAKLAMDSGEAASPQEALLLFSKYRIRLHLGEGWADTYAGQACFLTCLNTAARAFLGGVEVHGDLTPMLSVPLYESRTALSVVNELGGSITNHEQTELPTLVIGKAPSQNRAEFCVRMLWNAWSASVQPVANDYETFCEGNNSLAGVAAAALGVNEAFLFVRNDLPDAGHRIVGLSLWSPTAVTDWADRVHAGPSLKYLPKSLWLVGLGHLGQAYAWSLGMLPYPFFERPHLVLQDFDMTAESNLSTCLLCGQADVGLRKVRVVAQRLEAVGFTTDLVERRFGPNHQVQPNEPTTALFGVDNVNARRHLGTAGFSMVVEAGLGSGYRDFRNLRVHTFPSAKNPLEVWTASSGIQAAVTLNDVYKELVRETGDICGVTQLASRSVATPFVGALTAALVLSEVMRPLHGGKVHSVLDLQMKNLRYRIAPEPKTFVGQLPPYIRAQTLLQVTAAMFEHGTERVGFR